MNIEEETAKELDKKFGGHIKKAPLPDTSNLFHEDPRPKPQTKSKSKSANVFDLFSSISKKQWLFAGSLFVALLIVGTSSAFLATRNNKKNEPLETASNFLKAEQTEGLKADPAQDETTTTDDSNADEQDQTVSPPPSSKPSGGGGSASSNPGDNNTNNNDNKPPSNTASTHEISYTNSCYNPSQISIKAGDTIKFINNSSRDMWPASDQHPSHTEFSDFDSRGSISPGGSYSFTFHQKKSSGYGFHDHNKPGCKGTIFVE